MPPPPKVLVSVLNYNNATDVMETIACYRRQTYPNFDLQVVDNASTEDCVTRIRERFPDLKVIRLEKNGGYTAGNNYALERGLAEGYDYVLISNHDVVVPKDLLARLVETAQAQSDCGMAGVVEEDHRTGRIRAVGGRGFRFWRARGRWLKDIPAGSNGCCEVDYVQGAVILFSRKALLRGIRFDERLFMYGEEIDLSFQLKQKGLRAFTDLRCRIRHKSPEGTLSPFQGYYLQRNRLYLCRKHGSFLSYAAAVLYTLLAELPVKTVVRVAQKHPRFAWACWNGFRDALRGSMYRNGRDA